MPESCRGARIVSAGEPHEYCEYLADAMSRNMDRTIVHLTAGARPNFMKIAPLYFALKEETWCEPVLIHTGQHYDEAMSDEIWRDLGLPQPDIALGVGRGSHGEQTASVMMAYEKVCQAQRPDWVVVVGDVNSTLACTLVAKKLGIAVAHLEAGLRSRDRSMPEEINRICTDAIADLLWTPSPDADENLQHEGIEPSRIERVGNIMLDSLERIRSDVSEFAPAVASARALGSYGVVTLHRPTNVDEESRLRQCVDALAETSKTLPLVFPIHPRTRASLDQHRLMDELAGAPQIHCLEPLGYRDFMSLIFGARLVITDSGGIQEETTYLSIPCLTVRDTTERPITITNGTNKLIRAGDLAGEVLQIMTDEQLQYPLPEFWDGKTAPRVVASLRRAVGISDGFIGNV